MEEYNIYNENIELQCKIFINSLIFNDKLNILKQCSLLNKLFIYSKFNYNTLNCILEIGFVKPDEIAKFIYIC